jgi:hypothetical protein
VLVPPIEPMLAKSVPILPEPVGRQDLRLEPKFDGFRVIAFCRPDEVVLQSRAGRMLTRYFPDIASVLHTALPGRPVIDGELVVWNPARSRTDFALLQQRITAGRRLPQLVRDLPASFVNFDVLQDEDGEVLMSRPLWERRERLAALLADAPPALTLCPQTTSTAEALEWMQTLTHAGIEGVVAKDAAGRYVPGRRGWLKYKSVGVGGVADEVVLASALVGEVCVCALRARQALLQWTDKLDGLRCLARTPSLITPSGPASEGVTLRYVGSSPRPSGWCTASPAGRRKLGFSRSDTQPQGRLGLAVPSPQFRSSRDITRIHIRHTLNRTRPGLTAEVSSWERPILPWNADGSDLTAGRRVGGGHSDDDRQIGPPTGSSPARSLGRVHVGNQP